MTKRITRLLSVSTFVLKMKFKFMLGMFADLFHTRSDLVAIWMSVSLFKRCLTPPSESREMFFHPFLCARRTRAHFMQITSFKCCDNRQSIKMFIIKGKRGEWKVNFNCTMAFSMHTSMFLKVNSLFLCDVTAELCNWRVKRGADIEAGKHCSDENAST